MRLFLSFIALACAALIAYAVYLQIALEMFPCPWCVIQRYIYAAIGIVCLVGAVMPATLQRFASRAGALLSFAGAGTAGWLIYTQAHPGVSCGIDPMESAINTLLPAQMFPLLFEAQGLCATVYDDIMGLSVSQWSLICFIVLAIALSRVSFLRK